VGLGDEARADQSDADVPHRATLPQRDRAQFVGPSPAFPCNPASASTRGRARHRGGGRPLAARADRRAKRSGLPFALYDEADNRSDPWRLALIAGLRRGRRRRELVLHYQPKPRLAA